MKPTTFLVVAWHNAGQFEAFKRAWKLTGNERWLVAQQDVDRQGCAQTKNAGVRTAVRRGAEIIVILDDDCLPASEDQTILMLIEAHEAALEPVEYPLFESVTDPPSRGTPYLSRAMPLPVAASMGFWTEVGDYDAPAQLVHGARHPMTFRRLPIYGRFFPLCGMNLAFRPADWLPWCEFIDVPRFDDIWMGWLWQREAYRRGHCFNLAGPLVRHSRQSNVWANLRDEAMHLEANETLWARIARHASSDYATLRALLPA